MPGDDALVTAIRAADKAAVARALNLVEDRRAEAQSRTEALLSELGPHHAAQRVGLTGPPGVGKSTLAAALALEWRARQLSVGIVAVDPSSTRSGGALLGDRARMSFDPADESLFVRSLATAGDTGGLAYAANAAVEVLSAAYDRVLVETTGVGQTETDVEHVVDSVCLVIQPGSGDVLQFIKAGIMEIPDLVVVNKGDHEALARRAASDLTGALDALRGVGMGATPGARWQVPVLVTSARDRTGIEALADGLEAHRASFGDADLSARRQAGAAHWAASLFERRHGEHGVATLGGRVALRERLRARLGEGASAAGLAGELSREYLQRIHGLGR